MHNCAIGVRQRGEASSSLRCLPVGRAQQASRQSSDREVPGVAPGLNQLADSGSGQPFDVDKEFATDSFVQPATESVTAGAAGAPTGLLAVHGMAGPLMQGYLWNVSVVWSIWAPSK